MKNCRNYLEKKAKQQLIGEGYQVERAFAVGLKRIMVNGKPRYINTRHDFFNVIDLIAVKDNDVRFIQVTSSNTVSKKKGDVEKSLYNHKKKIEANWKNSKAIELWFFIKIKSRWKLYVHYYSEGKWISPTL